MEIHLDASLEVILVSFLIASVIVKFLLILNARFSADQPPGLVSSDSEDDKIKSPTVSEALRSKFVYPNLFICPLFCSVRVSQLPA